MNPVSLERKTAELRGNEPLLSVAEFEAAVRAVGPERYHDLHPFHHMLHGGKLNKGQVQAWALNRYCYQSAVPR
jgi:pyrroloquinoline-quinone synthase